MNTLPGRGILWVAFIAAHGFYTLVLWAQTTAMGDVTRVYRGWIGAAVEQGQLPGITTDFIYPVGAVFPMLLAHYLGPGNLYGPVWLLFVLALNSVGLALLVGRGRDRFAGLRLRAAWFWTIFLWLLGPVAFGRIDALTVPLAVIALLQVRRFPALSGFWAAVGAWVKVWPAALVMGLFAILRGRWAVLLGAAAVTAGIVIPPLVMNGPGSFEHLLSFVSGQTGRGLQVESTAGSVFALLTALRVPGLGIVYRRDILTFQVTGPGVDVVSTLLTPLMAIAAAAVLGLAWLAHRRTGRLARILPATLLALVLVLIVFNKVGSPQFMNWLIAPIIFGLLWDGRTFARLAVITLVVAALTQYIYPWAYDEITGATAFGAVLLIARNLLLILLLVLALRPLVAAGSPTPAGQVPPRRAQHLQRA